MKGVYHKSINPLVALDPFMEKISFDVLDISKIRNHTHFWFRLNLSSYERYLFILQYLKAVGRALLGLPAGVHVELIDKTPLPGF